MQKRKNICFIFIQFIRKIKSFLFFLTDIATELKIIIPIKYRKTIQVAELKDETKQAQTKTEKKRIEAPIKDKPSAYALKTFS